MSKLTFETGRRILDYLIEKGPSSTTKMAEELGMSVVTLYRYLRAFEEAGLVRSVKKRTRKGRIVLYYVDPEKVNPKLDFVGLVAFLLSFALGIVFALMGPLWLGTALLGVASGMALPMVVRDFLFRMSRRAYDLLEELVSAQGAENEVR